MSILVNWPRNCSFYRSESGSDSRVDKLSREKRSRLMSKIRSRDTKLELAVRRALWSNGFRYRTHYGYGKADLVFPKAKMAIFVDSCFWHACPRHREIPKTNVLFWRTKLERNRERDRLVDQTLKKNGWQIVRIWEHELVEDFDRSIRRIVRLVSRAR